MAGEGEASAVDVIIDGVKESTEAVAAAAEHAVEATEAAAEATGASLAAKAFAEVTIESQEGLLGLLRADMADLASKFDGRMDRLESRIDALGTGNPEKVGEAERESDDSGNVAAVQDAVDDAPEEAEETLKTAPRKAARYGRI